MKVFLLFCLIMLVTCGGQKKKPQNENSCVSKNPFLAQLSAAHPVNVTVFDQPKFSNFTSCKVEWSKYGTCCDQGTLLTFLKNEQDAINKSKKQLEDTIGRVSSACQSAAAWLVKERSSYSGSWKLAVKFTVFSTKSIIKEFRRSSDQCWNYMSQIRSSAMCSTCSGKSQDFFKGSKILISPIACKNAVVKCADFFFDVSTISKELKSLLEELKPYLDKSKIMDPLIKVEGELVAHSPPAALMSSFVKYAENPRNPVIMGESAAKICSMIVNIRKAPYINGLNFGDHLRLAFEWLGKRTAKFVLDVGKKLAKAGKEAVKKAARIAKEEVKKMKKAVEESAKKIGKAVKNGVKKAGKAVKNGIKKAGKHLKAGAKKFGNKMKKGFGSFGKGFKSFGKKFKRSKKLKRKPCRSSKPSRSKKSRPPRRSQPSSRSNRVSKRAPKPIIQRRKHQRPRYHRRVVYYHRRPSRQQSRPKPRKQNRRGRRLNSFGMNMNNDPFKSDSLVFLKPGDSMFDSFEGFKGTATFNQYSPMRPMNISLAFP